MNRIPSFLLRSAYSTCRNGTQCQSRRTGALLTVGTLTNEQALVCVSNREIVDASRGFGLTLVWCMAYTQRSEGGSDIAHSSCNGIAIA